MPPTAAIEAPPGLPQRYSLVRRLGRGGQGETHLARDLERDVDVAIKIFRLPEAEDWKKFDLFERECRVLRSIDHPAIPGYVEHGGDEETGTFHLVMAYAPGATLEASIAAGRRFTDAQLLAILDPLLDVLEYLHSLNPPVIHRDIKPGNVIVGDDGRVWLVDFGGVREALADRSKSTVVGTFGYMAPEQLRGEALATADLYGLGATIAAAATGSDASTLPTRGLEIDLASCIKPGPLRTALAEMLRPDPRTRAADVAQVRKRLRPPAPTPAAVLAPAPPTHARQPRDEVEALVVAGDRYEAIRRYRALTGAPLLEATKAVDALQRRLPGKPKLKLSPKDELNVGVFATTTGALLFMLTPPAFALCAFVATWLFSRSLVRGYRSEE